MRTTDMDSVLVCKNIHQPQFGGLENMDPEYRVFLENLEKQEQEEVMLDRKLTMLEARLTMIETKLTKLEEEEVEEDEVEEEEVEAQKEDDEEKHTAGESKQDVSLSQQDVIGPSLPEPIHGN